ncbi:hypothetical protein VUR80DRAFT_2812 [Thermomyces stellatus]
MERLRSRTTIRDVGCPVRSWQWTQTPQLRGCFRGSPRTSAPPGSSKSLMAGMLDVLVLTDIPNRRPLIPSETPFCSSRLPNSSHPLTHSLALVGQSRGHSVSRPCPDVNSRFSRDPTIRAPHNNPHVLSASRPVTPCNPASFPATGALSPSISRTTQTMPYPVVQAPGPGYEKGS